MVLTPYQQLLESVGLCPFCGQRPIEGYEPFGPMAPLLLEAMGQNGIDPATGHEVGCPYKSIDYETTPADVQIEIRKGLANDKKEKGSRVDATPTGFDGDGAMPIL